MKRKKPLSRKTPLRAKPKKEGVKVRKKKGPSKTALKRKTDLLCGAWFRSDSVCTARGEVCMSDGTTECNGMVCWCHIFTRGIGVLRWHPLNATTMCGRHHKWYTDHPSIFGLFIEKIYPGRTELLYLLERTIKPRKPDPEFWTSWYKSRTDNFRTWDGEI